MKEMACPYYQFCHMKRVGKAAANAEIIREIYCCGDPTGCKTYLRVYGIESEADKKIEKTPER